MYHPREDQARELVCSRTIEMCVYIHSVKSIVASYFSPWNRKLTCMILIVYSHKAINSSNIQRFQESPHTFCILQCASIWIDGFYTSCHGYRLSYLLCTYPHSAIQSNSAFKWKSSPKKRKEEMFWIQKTKDDRFSKVRHFAQR